MSAPEPAKRVLRTVSPPYRGRPDAEMTTIGWLLFVGMLFVLVPLLPFLVIVWLLTKVADYIASQTASE
jgi:hypothetical protein